MMVMMTRLDDKDQPIEVDAVRYGDLAVAKPEKFDTLPWVVFHAPTGRDVVRALPDHLTRRGTKRRDVKEWCVAFQNDARAKPIWKMLHRGSRELSPEEAGLMIGIGQSI